MKKKPFDDFNQLKCIFSSTHWCNNMLVLLIDWLYYTQFFIFFKFLDSLVSSATHTKNLKNRYLNPFEEYPTQPHLLMLVAGLELSDQEKILAVKTELQSKMLSDKEQLDEEGNKKTL